ncbi:MAG TPA: hypothetical protein VM617_07675 [Thermoanaerobaculia bacterium]|nr:hypothetical protein [Thermoanaerobaculia bacterium]
MIPGAPSRLGPAGGPAPAEVAALIARGRRNDEVLAALAAWEGRGVS